MQSKIGAPARPTHIAVWLTAFSGPLTTTLGPEAVVEGIALEGGAADGAPVGCRPTGAPAWTTSLVDGMACGNGTQPIPSKETSGQMRTSAVVTAY
jgi:hypothetical protein